MAIERIKRLPAAASYRVRRRAEYPPVGDQLEALWAWARAGGLAPNPAAPKGSAPEVLARIAAVKAKHPKGRA